MITIFNRKELCIIRSIKQQAQIRDILAAHQIDYTLSMSSRNGLGLRNRSVIAGGFMEDVNWSTEYTFYVKKQDYERASFLIHQPPL